MGDIAHVTAAGIAVPCPYCGRASSPDEPWVRHAQRAWGWCGFAVEQEQRTVAVLLLSPDLAGERALITTAWVEPAFARRGLGKRLVQAACAGMVGRGVHTIVARANIGQPSCTRLPRAFLRRTGFVYLPDEHLWGLDVDAAVIDRPTLWERVGRLGEALSPYGRPEPAARQET